MGKYPNAAAGFKNLFIAEILSLIAIAAGVVVGFISSDVSSIVKAIISLIAGILTLIGLSAASKDSEVLKKAFTITVVGLILSIVAGIVEVASSSVGAILTPLVSLVVQILDIVVLYYVLHGGGALCTDLGNTEIEPYGHGVWKINVASLIISAAAFILMIIGVIVAGVGAVSGIAGGSASGLVGGGIVILLGGIATIVAAIFSLIAGIKYIIYLNKVANALA